MPSFEIQVDIFTRLSIFDSPKGSSNTFKTHKNINLYFKRRYLIIYKYHRHFQNFQVSSTDGKTLSAGLIETVNQNAESILQCWKERVSERAKAVSGCNAGVTQVTHL